MSTGCGTDKGLRKFQCLCKYCSGSQQDVGSFHDVLKVWVD